MIFKIEHTCPLCGRTGKTSVTVNGFIDQGSVDVICKCGNAFTSYYTINTTVKENYVQNKPVIQDRRLFIKAGIPTAWQKAEPCMNVADLRFRSCHHQLCGYCSEKHYHIDSQECIECNKYQPPINDEISKRWPDNEEICFSQIPKYVEHMSKRDFLTNVEATAYVDDDGYGHYAKKNYVSNLVVKPSDVYGKPENWDRRFTHVVWHNR